jgi:hypothetical protein
VGIVLYIFWPAIAAFIPGGLFAIRRPIFASVSIVILLAVVTYQRLTSVLTVDRASAVGVSWAEVAVGVLVGWAGVRRFAKLPSA